MAVVALLSAQQRMPPDAARPDGPQGGEEELRALTLIAGQTVLERQMAALASVGASAFFLAVQTVPAALLALVDRVRAQGLPLQLVRTMAELADATQPDDVVLIVDDGLYADAPYVRALVDAPVPTILVTPDVELTRNLERIDGGARWSGLASVSGLMVDELRDTPDEWDVPLTLLRRGLQATPRRLGCDPAHVTGGEITVVDTHILREVVERHVLSAARPAAPGTFRNGFAEPLARIVGPSLLRQPGAAALVPVISALVTAAGFALGWLGQPAAVAWLGLLVSVLTALAAYLATFRKVDGALLATVAEAAPWAMLAAFALAVWQHGPMETDALIGLAAQMGTVVATAAIARLLFDSIGRRRQAGWMLPDIGIVWVAVTVAATVGLGRAVWIVLPLLVALQLLGWLILTRPQGTRNAGAAGAAATSPSQFKRR